MQECRVRVVDAFTTEPLGGNPAGVIAEAAELTAAQMQAVARELGASETAFLAPSEVADRRIRFFSPTQPVELCGHATVASVSLLGADGVFDPGSYTLETDAGILDVELAEDGRVWMDQPAASTERLAGQAPDPETLAELLGVQLAGLTEIGTELPVGLASTGLRFLLVPVAFLTHLGELEPRMDGLGALCERLDAAGVLVYSFDTLEAASTLHGRVFAPGLGVPEDPVTGMAAGAVAAYLDAVGAIDERTLRIEQGDFLERGGRIDVELPPAPSVDGVRVGGHAVTSLEGHLQVPPSDEQTILEG